MASSTRAHTPALHGTVSIASGATSSMSAVPKFSKSTEKLLQSMIAKSNLPKRQKMALLHHVYSDPTGALPFQSPAAAAASRASPPARAPIKAVYRMEPGAHKPSKRLQPEIAQMCGNYERELFRPSPRRDRGEQITKLQKSMVRGTGRSILECNIEEGDDEEADVVGRARPKKKERRRVPDPEPAVVDPIEELLAEIEDRHAFMASMEKLGKGAEYQTKIAAEINTRVRQVERLAKTLNEAEVHHGGLRLPPI
ncbi:hypothetical protein BC828DRAFT_381750 [Blastocladiella britannica]|nr:hypothetical protein BC828DRAFT_381750 [Blastocladiella britannica]